MESTNRFSDARRRILLWGALGGRALRPTLRDIKFLFPSTDAASLIDEMIQARMLLTRFDGRTMTPSMQVIVDLIEHPPVETQIGRYRSVFEHWSYEVTDSGFHEWEAVAHPDWSVYFRLSFVPPDRAAAESTDPGAEADTAHILEFCAATRDIVDRFFSLCKSTWRILDETCQPRFDVIKDFRVCQYKVLPEVHRVCLDHHAARYEEGRRKRMIPWDTCAELGIRPWSGES